MLMQSLLVLMTPLPPLRGIFARLADRLARPGRNALDSDHAATEDERTLSEESHGLDGGVCVGFGLSGKEHLDDA
jgi:hypothetical protein